MAGLVVSVGGTVDDGGAGNGVSGLRGVIRVVGLELRILGPVQAVRDGRDVPLGGPRQRAVLALLVLDAGRVVPAGHLAEALWQGRPPSGAAKTLRSYVSRLRGVLAPEFAVTARGGGYALIVESGQVDAGRFERLVGAGQGALGLGEAAPAASRFAEALALWRGRALADVTDVEPLALEAGRLEELRLVAVEGHAEASIALGLHGEVVAELERLVAEYPVRERLWRLLVLALYRAERQADALAAFRRARVMLAEELGLEPGEELRELAQAVLRQEVPAAPRRPRHGLPVPLTSFVGREDELAALDKLLGRARLVTLTGPGGAGKTRLAVELATGADERFPDGVWLADLAGVTDAELVPSRVMEALGVRQTVDLPVIEALRYRLRSAELLLVLDNCEHLLDSCARLAEDLLGSSPGLRVLATSREALGVPGDRAALGWSLGPESEIGPRLAVALGDFWLSRGFYHEERSWLERALATLSADGPLRADLLRLLGTVLWTAFDLERASAVLAEGVRVAQAAGLPAAAARISVHLLDIGTLVTGFTPETVTGCEAAVAALEAAGDLAGLADAWTLIGKMRLFIAPEPPGSDEEALERAIGYAQRSGNGRAERDATIWLMIILTMLRVPADAAIRRAEQALAAARDPLDKAIFGMGCAPVYAYAGRIAEARAAVAHSRTRWAESGAGFFWAICAHPAGLIEMAAGDAAAAEREMRGGYEALREAGERGYRASIAGVLADAVYCQGRLAEAQQLADEARDIAVTGDPDAHVRWRAVTAKLLARRGEFQAARELADEALALIPATTWPALLAETLTTKAEVLRLAGEPDEARDCLRQALDIYTERRAVPLAERARSALADLGA